MSRKNSASKPPKNNLANANVFRKVPKPDSKTQKKISANIEAKQSSDKALKPGKSFNAGQLYLQPSDYLWGKTDRSPPKSACGLRPERIRKASSLQHQTPDKSLERPSPEANSRTGDGIQFNNLQISALTEYKYSIIAPSYTDKDFDRSIDKDTHQESSEYTAKGTMGRPLKIDFFPFINSISDARSPIKRYMKPPMPSFAVSIKDRESIGTKESSTKAYGYPDKEELILKSAVLEGWTRSEINLESDLNLHSRFGSGFKGTSGLGSDDSHEIDPENSLYYRNEF
jgi:hypothetical protein